MRNYTDNQLALQREVQEIVAADPKAIRRGVTVVRMHIIEWRLMGAPIWLLILDKPTPIEPTGTRRNWCTWRYRRKTPACKFRS